MRQILRQIVAVLALVGLSMNLVPSALAATSYTDVSAANKLANAGIIVNNSANTAGYHLNDNVLRQEAVKVVAGALGGILENEANYTCTGAFSDVARGTWVCRIAELAKNAGLVAANPTFRPTAKLSRLEAIIFALRSAELMPAGDHSTDQILGYAVDAGLITSAAGINANAAATRGEFFRYVAKALDAAELPDICTLAPDLCGNNGNNGGNNGGNTSGSVSASLTAGQPTGLIVAGQATADLARFTFSGNGTVNSVVLTRTGISDQNTLSNVYLYDGVTRLTDGYSFNSNGSITINNLGLAVNGSRTITVKGDVAAATASGQTIAITLAGYTVAGSSAATVNLMGSTLTTGSGSTLATVQFSGANSTAAATVNAGVTSYVFWSQAVQVNTRTVSLKAANFRMVGSAPSDALSNIRLFVDGVDTGVPANVIMTNGSNYASFDFTATPMSLTTGSHTFEVRGDIQKGSNRTIQFSIQQASDLMIMDPQVGVNIAVDTIAGGSVPSSGGTITINTGSVTANLDPTFQTMTNVTGGGSNTTIAKFKLHAYGEDMKIQSLSILPVLTGTTPAAAGLDSLTLYYNGSQVGTQVNWTAGAQTFQLGSQLIVAAGQDGFLEVRANIRTTTGTNYSAGSVSANLIAGTGTAQGMLSLNTTNTPGATGNVLTIQTGNLSVSKNSAYANTSLNPNSAAVKIGSFVLQNQSTSESVRVTNLNVALTLGVGTSLTNLSALMTSETSGSGSNPVQPQATNAFSVNFTLAPGATKTIDVFATSGNDSGVTVTVIPTLTVTSIGTTSNVTNTSGAIVGQTVTFSNATITTPTTAANFIANASSNAQFVAAGPSSAGSLVDGTKNVFKLVATGGAATVSELKFVVVGSDGTPSNSISSIKVGVNGPTAPVVGGVAYVTGLNIAVPNGGSGYSMEVYPTYSNIGTNGLTSGTTTTINLGYIKYTSGGATSTICTAALGTCTAPIAVGGVVANTMTLVASKPTVTVAKPTGVVASVGNIEAIDVTIAADAKGDITLNSLPITVGVGGGSTTVSTAANAIIVTKLDNSSVTTTATALGAATGGSSTITFTGGYLIPAGTSQTFRVFVPVTAITAGVSGSTSLSTSLAATTGFSWTDTAGASVTPVTGTTNIFGYPNTFTSTINN